MAFDLSKLSATAASNDQVNYFQTGMRPSAVKTAGWNIGAIVAQLFNSKTTSVGTNTITLTNPNPLTSLTAGCWCVFTPQNANTGAVTFAPDGLTAHAINAYGSALQGGELSTSVPAIVVYDLASTTWNLINPQRNTNADYAVASGTNTVTATIPGLTAYYNGLRVKLKMANTSTASVTVNLNSLGALNVYLSDTVTRDVAGMFIQNQIAELVYNSSLNAAAGGFEFINPSRVLSSATVTQTGFASPPTGTLFYAIEPSGKAVSAWITSLISGTSNASTMTWTGIPAALASATDKRYISINEDVGVFTASNFLTGTSTTWTFGNGLVTTGGFTTSGTKGVTKQSWFISLD